MRGKECLLLPALTPSPARLSVCLACLSCLPVYLAGLGVEGLSAACADCISDCPCCVCVCCCLPVLQDYEWRDYVRGKDLHKFLSSKQDLLDQFTKPQGPGAFASAKPRGINTPGSKGFRVWGLLEQQAGPAGPVHSTPGPRYASC